MKCPMIFLLKSSWKCRTIYLKKSTIQFSFSSQTCIIYLFVNTLSTWPQCAYQLYTDNGRLVAKKLSSYWKHGSHLNNDKIVKWILIGFNSKLNISSFFFREGSSQSHAHNAAEDIVLSQKNGETVITDIAHVKNGGNDEDNVAGHDDDLGLLRESYADPDDNYVHLLGFKIPKLWRVLWGSGEEDKKIRWDPEKGGTLYFT